LSFVSLHSGIRIDYTVGKKKSKIKATLFKVVCLIMAITSPQIIDIHQISPNSPKLQHKHCYAPEMW